MTVQNLLGRGASRLARGLTGTITHVRTTDPVVALTFDDGPSRGATPKVLDLLERHGAKGTFFVLGKQAEAHPEILARAAYGGHAICNHSWSHPQFPRLTPGNRRGELLRCALATAPFGHPLFRPPYGYEDLRSRLDALRMGYRLVGWNLNTGDWCTPDPHVLIDRIREGLRPGAIVLFHDNIFVAPTEAERPALDTPVHADRSAMLTALAYTLETYSGIYRFVTVPELLKRGKACRAAP